MLWNCGGATNQAIFRYCKQYREVYHPNIIVIMETRIDPMKLSKSFSKLGFDDFAYANCQGFAGGIIVTWKKKQIFIQVEKIDLQYLHLSISTGKEANWWFTPVYASPKDELRTKLWEDLSNIANNMTKSWLVAGDFNDIKS